MPQELLTLPCFSWCPVRTGSGLLKPAWRSGFAQGLAGVGAPEDGLKVACTEVPGVGTTSEQGLQHPTLRPPGYPAVTSQSLWVQLTSPASSLLA